MTTQTSSHSKLSKPNRPTNVRARVLAADTPIYKEMALDSEVLVTLKGESEIYPLGEKKSPKGGAWLELVTADGTRGFSSSELKLYVVKKFITVEDCELYQQPQLSAAKRTVKPGYELYTFGIKTVDGTEWVRVRDRQGAEAYLRSDQKVKFLERFPSEVPNRDENAIALLFCILLSAVFFCTLLIVAGLVMIAFEGKTSFGSMNGFMWLLFAGMYVGAVQQTTPKVARGFASTRGMPMLKRIPRSLAAGLKGFISGA